MEKGKGFVPSCLIVVLFSVFETVTFLCDLRVFAVKERGAACCAPRKSFLIPSAVLESSFGSLNIPE